MRQAGLPQLLELIKKEQEIDDLFATALGARLQTDVLAPAT